MPSKKEVGIVIGALALFLLLTGLFIGLRTEHLLMVAIYLVLFFAGLPTRKLAVALLPFFVFGISYDWMRICPNYQVNPIDVAGLYNAEKSLFGVMDGGVLVTPCEYFAANHWAIADIFAGIFYLCWVPVPIAFGIWLYLSKSRNIYLRFAMVFLLVNLIGFAGYYIHPAAPPWYAINYGFEPILNTPGNVAGLGRFDALTGLTVFDSMGCAGALCHHAGVNFEPPSRQLGSGHGPGMQAPNLIVNFCGWFCKINGTHGFLQHGRIGDFRRVLWSGRHSSCLDSVQSLGKQICSQQRQPVQQFSGGLLRTDGGPNLINHVSGIHFPDQIHGRHAGLLPAVQHRPLIGSRATVFRQQTGMDIDAAPGRNV